MRDAQSELARINDKGEAHPIGRLASQRMRRREGTFRVLPAPDHVVFMRYTGEDGRRDEGDGAIVRMAGEITSPGAALDVIAMLAAARWPGELIVLTEERARRLYMENGNIVGAVTNVPEERIGEVMFRYGGIDRDGLARVIAEVESGGRFGEAAVRLGLMTEGDVYRFVGHQIEEVVFGTLEEDDGTFFFLDGFDPDKLVSHHTLNADMLLMDLVTRLDEIRYFRQRIPGSDWVPVAMSRETGPADEYRDLLAHVDGKCSVADIGRACGWGEFETTKALYALCQSQHVTMHPPRLEGGIAALVGVANAALRLIHQQVDGKGRGSFFRETLSGFAAGAGVYELLFRGAGPNERGELDAEQLVDNVTMLAGDDEEAFLKDKLHEYISFALFAAGAALGGEGEAELKTATHEILAALHPVA